MHINRNGRMALLALLLIAVCAYLSTSFAQQGTSVWVSFSAVKVSRVYQLSTSGRELIKETRQFTARSKDGSSLCMTQLTTIRLPKITMSACY